MKQLKEVVKLILQGIGLGVCISGAGNYLGLWHTVFMIGRHVISCQ